MVWFFFFFALLSRPRLSTLRCVLVSFLFPQPPVPLTFPLFLACLLFCVCQELTRVADPLVFDESIFMWGCGFLCFCILVHLVSVSSCYPVICSTHLLFWCVVCQHYKLIFPRYPGSDRIHPHQQTSTPWHFDIFNIKMAQSKSGVQYIQVLHHIWLSLSYFVKTNW